MTEILKLSAYWVNAFTTQPFCGNPAVVIPTAAGLSDDQKQLIAREVNCSETAFVEPAQSQDADFRLRWFTPTQEVSLCGHATLATIQVLCELGWFNLKKGTNQVLYLETLSGILSAFVDFTQSDRAWIWLSLPSCDFQTLEPTILAQVAAGLRLDPRQLKRGVIESLNQDVLVQVESLAMLQSLDPDFKELHQLGDRHQWRGFCCYTPQTLDPAHAAHLRFFAPQSGILEDPVTGSVSGPLGLHLRACHQVMEDHLILEQGDSLGRSGRIHLDLSNQKPRLGGQAVTILRGEFEL
ncbi:PhzF family phenazine biosynthesis protein [Lyngbya confervoides]|uniref:PhzF family phenazine biosynthesis protein n=1 Tax=Lyngbya confervoides BDU141951 TaxID=1574623 RepID=A0ABD4SXQ7_9CYAN|nr:PhzF family phenazine biosynthesis protein [Lyngbya confervoides]MCM1981361.1 PhzF family phenazine biosynthesis protein [Lyngbya confervoides BDU141951]